VTTTTSTATSSSSNPYYSSSIQQQPQPPKPVSSATTTTTAVNDWYSGTAAPSGYNNSSYTARNPYQQQQQQAPVSPVQQQQQQQQSLYYSHNSPVQQQQPPPPQQQPHFHNSWNDLSGTMDMTGQGSTSTFIPQMATTVSNNPSSSTFFSSFKESSSNASGGYFHNTISTNTTTNHYPDDDDLLYDFTDEPPLLEELGINVEHILLKTKAVVIPFRRFQPHSALFSDPQLIVEDADLAGPLALALLLGGELLLTGQLSFGYIYGFGVFGCLAMTVILNLMSPETPVSFWTVTSILGYALLPVNLLAAVKILVLGNDFCTRIFAVPAVLWSTTASTRLLEYGCGLASQRYLLAYPIALLYSAFVLITIF
jgi:hypothetical protein